eukprot:1860963-Rhodomonas_salina.2
MSSTLGYTAPDGDAPCHRWLLELFFSHVNVFSQASAVASSARKAWRWTLPQVLAGFLDSGFLFQLELPQKSSIHETH